MPRALAPLSRRGVWIGLALAWVTAAPQESRAQAPAGPERWEKEIAAFEAADKTNPPPSQPIVFVGSSSIRLWKSLAQDFSGLKVLNRGFGGSQLADSAHFADRIVLPYRPRTVVLYAGDNDIAAGVSPEQVRDDFASFVKTVRHQLPDTRIAFISIKPSPSRWKLVEKIRSANQLIEDYCRKGDRLVYIDVFTAMLGDDGRPRDELFVQDRLHMNEKGYAIWTRRVRPHLQ
jgi:lysophospholipase L1-like esterase